ncbi:conserved hypothetical protein [Tenacibaculum amylolyticum]
MVLFLTSITTFAQQRLTSFKNVLKENSTDIKDVIPVVNKENGNTIMFIADAKNVYGYKLNPEFQLIDKLASETKKRKYKIFIGGDIHGQDYRIFLSNTSQNKFASINFSFTNKTTSSTEFKLPQYEYFVQTIAPKNKLYLLTADKNSGNLYLYSFDKNGTPIKDKINLESTHIVGKYDRAVKIATLLTGQESVQKIEKDTPNAIETVSDPVKMYVRDGNIIITFDQNKKVTYVLNIDIESKNSSTKVYDKPLANLKSSRKKTNSFIYGDYMFGIAANKEIFSMHILDYPSGNFIKEYAVSKNEKISFKNTPIIQEGGAYNSYRELEKTKKFLRKITSENIGISVIKIAGDYLFTIGGYVNQRQGGGMMMMGGGFGAIPIGTIGSATFFFNPTMFAYNSFSNTKSTRIEGVFNDNFEHIPNKEIPENVFDKINDSKTYNETAKTVFRYKDFFIKGDYNTRTKIYHLKKFTE